MVEGRRQLRSCVMRVVPVPISEAWTLNLLSEGGGRRFALGGSETRQEVHAYVALLRTVQQLALSLQRVTTRPSSANPGIHDRSIEQ